MQGQTGLSLLFSPDVGTRHLRALVARKAGRPKKGMRDVKQDGFTFAA